MATAVYVGVLASSLARRALTINRDADGGEVAAFGDLLPLVFEAAERFEQSGMEVDTERTLAPAVNSPLLDEADFVFAQGEPSDASAPEDVVPLSRPPRSPPPRMPTASPWHAVFATGREEVANAARLVARDMAVRWRRLGAASRGLECALGALACMAAKPRVMSTGRDGVAPGSVLSTAARDYFFGGGVNLPLELGVAWISCPAAQRACAKAADAFPTSTPLLQLSHEVTARAAGSVASCETAGEMVLQNSAMGVWLPRAVGDSNKWVPALGGFPLPALMGEQLRGAGLVSHSATPANGLSRTLGCLAMYDLCSAPGRQRASLRAAKGAFGLDAELAKRCRFINLGEMEYADLALRRPRGELSLRGPSRELSLLPLAYKGAPLSDVAQKLAAYERLEADGA